MRGYAHVIKEDLVNPNLLFLGTEFGLWVSVDGGETVVAATRAATSRAWRCATWRFIRATTIS